MHPHLFLSSRGEEATKELCLFCHKEEPSRAVQVLITDFFALSQCWQIAVWFCRAEIILKEIYQSRYRTCPFPKMISFLRCQVLQKRNIKLALASLLIAFRRASIHSGHVQLKRVSSRRSQIFRRACHRAAASVLWTIQQSILGDSPCLAQSSHWLGAT